MVIPLLAPADGDPVGGGAARRAAQAELRRAEYHRDDPGFVDRALNWVGRQLSRLFAGGGGGHALLIVLIVLVAVAIVFAVRAGAPRRRAQVGRADGTDPLAPVTARDHRRIAAELTAQGRHAEALREWLRAAVQTIEERGVLPPRPGRTGAATAREAGPLLPSAAEDLATAMSAFDEVWFGGRPATAGDVVRARAAADGVAGARIVAGADAPDGMAVPW